MSSPEKESAPIAQNGNTDSNSTGPSKIYLRVPSLESKEYLKAKNIVDIFEGPVKVIFYDSSSSRYINYSSGIAFSEYIYNELVGLIGKENVVVK